MELQCKLERAVAVTGEAADREWGRLERGEGPGETLRALVEVMDLLVDIDTGLGRTYFEPGGITRVQLFETALIRGELLCLGTNADMGVAVLPWRFGVSRVVSGEVTYVTLGNLSRREDGLVQADILGAEAALHYHSSPSTGLRGLAACQQSIVMDVFCPLPVKSCYYRIHESRNGTAILAHVQAPIQLRDKGYRGQTLRVL